MKLLCGEFWNYYPKYEVSTKCEAKPCGVYAPSPFTGETPGLLYFLREHLQNLRLFPWKNLLPSAPNFKETLIVAIKQGGIAKAAISAVLKRIDSIVKYSPFLIVEVALKGEIVKEGDILIITS